MYPSLPCSIFLQSPCDLTGAGWVQLCQLLLSPFLPSSLLFITLQVGAFPHFGNRWAEWNGKFRDVVRSFIKGSEGPWAGDFAAALCGSPNIYDNAQPHDADW